MTNDQNSSRFDLEERTARFGEQGITLARRIPRSPINDPLITQFVKCCTSVGANYSEADDAESREDFRHKIGICKKESRESKHFLRMMFVTCPELKPQIESLLQEAKELNLIFNSIYIKTRKLT